MIVRERRRPPVFTELPEPEIVLFSVSGGLTGLERISEAERKCRVGRAGVTSVEGGVDVDDVRDSDRERFSDVLRIQLELFCD